MKSNHFLCLINMASGVLGISPQGEQFLPITDSLSEVTGCEIQHSSALHTQKHLGFVSKLVLLA